MTVALVATAAACGVFSLFMVDCAVLAHNQRMPRTTRLLAVAGFVAAALMVLALAGAASGAR